MANPITKLLIPLLLCIIAVAVVLSITAGGEPRDDAYVVVLSWGKEGARRGRFNRPRTVAVSPAGNVYVADMTGRIQYFSREGKLLGGWRMPEYASGNPRRIRFLRDGTLCIADTHNNRICFFDNAGNLLSHFGEHGTEPGKFMMVSAVAEGPDGSIYTTEYGTTPTQRADPVDRIQRFTREGKLLGCWGKTGSGPGELSRPSGIDVDNNGLVYVADAINHRIQVFTSDGKYVRTLGRHGKEPGEMFHPFDICVGPNGNLFVIEFGNARVQELTTGGESVALFGTHGAELGRFYQPWGITVTPDGSIFVADTWNHRIQLIVPKSRASNRKQDNKETREEGKKGIIDMLAAALARR